MTIIGIDPGTATTGFGVIRVRGQNIEVLDYGVISTKKTLRDSERLVEIYDDLSTLLKKHKPQVACVEKLFFATNQKTAMSVSAARGVVMLLLEQLRVEVLEYTPLQVKSMITGFGKADKLQVQRVVQKTLQLSKIPKPDDAADALALAIVASRNQKRG